VVSVPAVIFRACTFRVILPTFTFIVVMLVSHRPDSSRAKSNPESVTKGTVVEARYFNFDNGLKVVNAWFFSA
jgi:hypothetical protein